MFSLNRVASACAGPRFPGGAIGKPPTFDRLLNDATVGALPQASVDRRHKRLAAKQRPTVTAISPDTSSSSDEDSGTVVPGVEPPFVSA
jgi:hypothetical protein